MNLEELMKAADAMLTELESLRGKVSEAKEEEPKKQAEEALKAKTVEYGVLEGKIDEEIASRERKGRLAKAKTSLEVQPPGDVAPILPATAKDQAKQMHDEERIFAGYMQGKALGDRERTLMSPKSPSFKEGAEGICVPAHLRQMLLGKRWDWAVTRGKVLLSAGTGQGEASLVPQEYIARMLELPVEPTHVMGMATIIPSTTGLVTLPRLVQTDANEYGGMSFRIISEGESKPETEPEFEQITIPTYEIAGYTEISIRMLSRSVIDLEALLGRLYRSGASAYLDNLWINGSGVGQPAGIVNTAGIRTVARLAAGDVDYEDLVRLKHAVLPQHRDNARFMLHDDVEMNLELDRDTQGRPLFSASTADGPRNRLVGYPYLVTLRQPALGVAGDVIYGDVSEYAIATEEEVVVRRSEHYRFRQNRVAFIVYVVMGGRLWQPRAMAILDDEQS